MSRTYSAYNDDETGLRDDQNSRYVPPLTPGDSPYHGDFTGIPDASPSAIYASGISTDEGEHPDVQGGGVKRELGQWQIFFIVIGGTISLGFFTDSGKVLSLAGPWGAMLAFFLVGIAVICVMRGITEMIQHWPISNALVEFVNSFVDKDLGVIVGTAYWFAYSTTFATLVSAATDLAAYWSWDTRWQIPIYNVVVPLVLLAINLMGVKWYGIVESVAGSLKIILVCGVCILMIVINAGAGVNDRIGLKYINDGFQHDPDVTQSSFVAVLVAMPIAAYAFCGVEIVAITALEAANAGKALKWPPTTQIAKVLFVLYLSGVFFFCLNVSWKDPSLISLPKRTSGPSSIAMIAVINANIPGLPGFLNACLILAILSTANTSLYVASRALYGLTRHERGPGTNNSLFDKVLCNLGTTNSRGVPMWALIASASLFGTWLPFVHSFSGYKDQGLQEIISGIATVAIILVWASQCLAFIRYRRWLAKHQRYIEEEQLWEFNYRGNGQSRLFSCQPFCAWVGLISCITVLVLMSVSWCHRGEGLRSILAAWTPPAVLLICWLVRKGYSRHKLGVELSDDKTRLRKELIRLQALISNQAPTIHPPSKESSRQSTFEVGPARLLGH